MIMPSCNLLEVYYSGRLQFHPVCFLSLLHCIISSTGSPKGECNPIKLVVTPEYNIRGRCCAACCRLNQLHLVLSRQIFFIGKQACAYPRSSHEIRSISLINISSFGTTTQQCNLGVEPSPNLGNCQIRNLLETRHQKTS